MILYPFPGLTLSDEDLLKRVFKGKSSSKLEILDPNVLRRWANRWFHDNERGRPAPVWTVVRALQPCQGYFLFFVENNYIIL